MRVAVIGLGSMGRRHASNLLALGHEVVGVDPAGTGLAIPCHDAIAGLGSVDAAVIASPAECHFSNVMELAGLPLLVEKPLGLTTDPWPKTKERVGVGYNWRFDPGLVEFREWLKGQHAVWTTFEYSQDLAEWRPGIPAASSPYLRTGLLLEASHEFDLAFWFNVPADIAPADIRYVHRAPGPYSDCDAINVMIAGASGTSEIHLDWIVPGYHRRIVALGWDGTRTWSAPSSPEETYRLEIAAFMESVAGRPDPRLATYEDGLRVLRFVAAVLAGANAVRGAIPGRVPVGRPN